MTIWHDADLESKPKGSVLLVRGYGKHKSLISGFWEEEDEEWYDDLDGEPVYHVTNWSILPEFPK